jgi:hypothetical protein
VVRVKDSPVSLSSRLVGGERELGEGGPEPPVLMLPSYMPAGFLGKDQNNHPWLGPWEVPLGSS